MKTKICNSNFFLTASFTLNLFDEFFDPALMIRPQIPASILPGRKHASAKPIAFFLLDLPKALLLSESMNASYWG
jgi:hypothetical protein